MSAQTATASSHVETTKPHYLQAIDEICDLNWTKLTEEDIIRVAWAYYHFSVQFRECLEIARKMYPDDERLLQLDHGERDTDNLSPWPGVAKPGEKMNHDEFMRRTLELAKIPETGRIVLSDIGKKYLNAVRAIDPKIQALALATYEDGGLERVFRAILTAPNWNGPLQEAFKHFLAEHIRFDSDPDQGHGALCRHLIPDDRVLPLWAEFKHMLTDAAPHLARASREPITAMSLKSAIIEQMEQIAREHGKILAPLKEGLVLADCGLDSLGFAVLVARLEDKLGIDPFTAAQDAVFPVTLGDFVKIYEHAAQNLTA